MASVPGANSSEVQRHVPIPEDFFPILPSKTPTPAFLRLEVEVRQLHIKQFFSIIFMRSQTKLIKKCCAKEGVAPLNPSPGAASALYAGK